MTQKELIDLLKDNVIKTQVYSDKKDEEILDITYNSKSCKYKTAFFAKGAHFKSEYIEDAINNGATLIISEKEYETKNAGLVVVKDVRQAMVTVAESFFDKAYEKLKVIGITGTKGKTTTATYLNNILNEYVQTKTGLLSTVETYTGARCEESHLSTPEAIELQRYIKEVSDNDLKFITMEVSSQAYKTKRIDKMPFDIGIFLNISEDHISPSEHPNFTDYLNSKLEFIKNSKIVIINSKTDYLESVLEAAKNAKKIITYGDESKKDSVDYYYTNVRKENGLLTFEVFHGNSYETYSTKMVGIFNIENALASIIVAKELNVEYEYIKRGILNTTVSGRMNVFTKEDKTIIVDYAHNKLSFEKFFEAVKIEYPNSDIFAVFGAPGGKAYGRRRDMAEVASKYCKKIYITADDPQYEKIKDICLQISTYVTVDYCIIEDRQEAIREAFNAMKKGDVLCLLAKGEDKYQQVCGKFEEYVSDIGMAKILTE